jgi:hypothetical protein
MSENKIIRNDISYYVEYVWRENMSDKTKDSNGKRLPFPKKGIVFGDKKNILDLLIIAHEILIPQKSYEMLDDPIDCHICGKKAVDKKKLFFLDRIWGDGIIHYIKEHNVEPSIPFKDFIYNQMFAQFESEIHQSIKTGTYCKSNKSNGSNRGRERILTNRLSKGCKKLRKTNESFILERVKINNEEYVKLEKNKILILDALMASGGKFKKYSDPYDDNIKRYSEHAGFLDFDNGRLQKVVVSGQTDRIDEGDDEIFLPKDMDDMLDYEYIFHTHPPTPKPGGRVDVGILYEFPSMGDIFHFIDHYNEGNVIGSLVIAAEGLYNIRRYYNKENQLHIMIDNDKKNNNENSHNAINDNDINDNDINDNDINDNDINDNDINDNDINDNDINDNASELIVDENELYDKYKIIFKRIQRDSINKYGLNFSTNDFYSLIAQDTSYINRFNKVLNQYSINIDYFPRSKDGKYWYINTIFLKIKPYE